MEKGYIIRWYGPFKDKSEARAFEKECSYVFNLYMMGGKIQSSKFVHYYIGKAERTLLCDRFNDKNHHIHDFTRINEIWIGSIINKKATHRDILTLETMLTSYIGVEVKLLNTINYTLPEKSIYLINEWIHYERQTECLRLPKISIANMMPDVLIYKRDIESGQYKLFISNKLKITE